jgi:hypothetical protein
MSRRPTASINASSTEGLFVMTGIFLRVGLVILMAVMGGIGGTIFAWLFSFVKAMLSGVPMVSLGTAAVFGFAWFGAIGALCGAAMGKDIAEEQGKTTTPGGNAAAWIVAVIIALIFLSTLFAR